MICSCITSFPILFPTPPIPASTPSQTDGLICIIIIIITIHIQICINIEIHQAVFIHLFSMACVHMVSGLTTLYWITNYSAHLQERLILPVSVVISCLQFLSRHGAPEISPFLISASVDITLAWVLFGQLYCGIILGKHSCHFLGDTVSH